MRKLVNICVSLSLMFCVDVLSAAKFTRSHSNTSSDSEWAEESNQDYMEDFNFNLSPKSPKQRSPSPKRSSSPNVRPRSQSPKIDMTCPICFDDQEKSQQKYQAQCCSKVFCQECLKGIAATNKSDCPLCRKKLIIGKVNSEGMPVAVEFVEFVPKNFKENSFWDSFEVKIKDFMENLYDHLDVDPELEPVCKSYYRDPAYKYYTALIDYIVATRFNDDVLMLDEHPDFYSKMWVLHNHLFS